MMFEKMCQQNMDLQSAMIEEREEHKKEIEKLTHQISKISTVTNNTTNNNNNKFNLNFFLNTQCKDAMSIQSFMENLKLGCKELEHMGDVGYLNGMIDIFNNTIGNMDVYKRPLHCTDLKREVLYFKQGNDWERDSEDKQHLKKLIKNGLSGVMVAHMEIPSLEKIPKLPSTLSKNIITKLLIKKLIYAIIVFIQL